MAKTTKRTGLGSVVILYSLSLNRYYNHSGCNSGTTYKDLNTLPDIISTYHQYIYRKTARQYKWVKLQTNMPRHCVWLSLITISFCPILHLSRSCRNVSLSPPAELLSLVDVLDCEIIPYKHDWDVINGKDLQHVWLLLFPLHF